MNKIILILILGIFFVNFASAEIQTLGTFKSGTDINLTQTCPDCTFNNITYINTPSSIIKLNKAMTKDGTFYNYTLLSGNTTELGQYIVNGVGDLGGTNTTWNYNFFITPTGFTLETSDSILYVIILISTFILFLAFLYPAITLPYSNEVHSDGSITRITKAKYLKLLSYWFAYGFLMWFLQTLNAISTSFIKLSYLSNFITNIFRYSQALSVGITFLILFIIMIEVWKDIILSKAITKHGKAYLDGRFT